MFVCVDWGMCGQMCFFLFSLKGIGMGSCMIKQFHKISI